MNNGQLKRLLSVKTADNIIKQHPLLMKSWHYEIGVMLTAMELVWDKTGDRKYFDYIRSNIDYFVDTNGTINTYTIKEYNLDQINTGKILLTLYRETHETKYQKAAFLLREQLKTHPRTSEGGFWHKQIYPSQMWLDGIYMGAPFYAEFGVVFNEPEVFRDVANQFILLYDHAKDPVTGLLYHAWNEAREQSWANPVTGCSPHFWGRAMGWYMMALVDVLDFMPSSADRKRLIEILNHLALALVNVQDSKEKVWYQVLDQGGKPGNYLEASASSMFIYAFAKGIHHGYLDDRFKDVAIQGFDGLMRNFIDIDGDLINLNGICSVAGLGKYKEDMEYRDGSYAYYISEPVVANDYKGVGPFIMACVELDK